MFVQKKTKPDKKRIFLYDNLVINIAWIKNNYFTLHFETKIKYKFKIDDAVYKFFFYLLNSLIMYWDQ